MIEGRISDILSVIDAGRRSLKKNIPFKGVSINSRTIQPGNLFFGIKGVNFDGSEYAEDALRKGAAAVIVNRRLSARDYGNIFFAKNPLAVLQKLAGWWRKRLSADLIGIAGSNGKTTVKDMIYHVFKDDRKTLKSPKSFNNHLGVPLTILEADPDTRLIVQEMEMNEPGGIKKLCGIAEPKYGVITNIGSAHLEFLKTIRNVYREKRELAEALPGDGALFINTDDPELRAINGRIKTRIICYSVRKPSDFKAEKIKSLSPGWEFYLKGIRFRLNVPGYFNICNSLAAASLASSLGLDLSYVAERLKTFRTGELRMEIIQKHGITFVLDCYNANPDSMKAAITAFLSEIPGKRKILILGDMLELGKKAGIYHRDIGSFLKKKKFRALLTTGSLSTHYGGTHFGSKEELKNNLKKLLKTGDAVLIKASRRLGLEELAK